MFDPQELDEFADLSLDTEPIHRDAPRWDESAGLTSGGDRWSTFSTIPDAYRAPQPWPRWLVTSGEAHDTELGILKSGKEADVFLLERADSVRSCLLAAKRYRSAEHKQFSRDDGYRAGRGVRKSRERRAMARKTRLGRELLTGQWAVYEWQMLRDLHDAGLPVPYPVSLDGTELVMEFVGDADGTAAPRLAQTKLHGDALAGAYQQVREVVLRLATMGLAHGDLSPFNILVAEAETAPRVVVIDWPQVVDVVANPDGSGFLLRDCRNVCTWFAARGLDVDADGGELFAEAVGML